MNRIRALVLATALVAAALLAAARLTPVDAGAVGDPGRGSIHQAGDQLPSACSATIDEAITPPTVRLCETAEVRVTAAMTCPAVLPVHMVIAIDRSKSMADPGDPTSAQIGQKVKSAGRNAVNALDWTVPGTMVGVLSHGFRVTIETDLTTDRGRALGGVNAVRYDSGDIGEDPGKAIERAQQMLEDERGTASPIEIIVLFGDGCDATVPSCPGASRRAAAAASGVGINIVTVCYAESTRSSCNDYRSLASQPRYAFQGDGRLPATIEEFQDSGRNLQLTALQLVEVLGPSVTFVAGSGVPAPRIGPGRLEFALGGARPGQTVTTTWRLGVTSVGVLPVRTNTSALNLTDTLGRTRTLPVPVRPITVTGPCGGPTDTPAPTATATTAATVPPTDTPTPVATDTPEDTPTPRSTATPTDTAVPPATDTPTPPPTSVPGVVYLPVLLKDACRKADVHTNVVLVIDASDSMKDGAGTGGGTKLEAAQAAARQFVDLLVLTPDADRAGVVAFNDTATVAAPIGSDRATLHAAIDGIETAPGTRMDAALRLAYGELTNYAGSLPVPIDNNNAVVLLTDGRPNPAESGPQAREVAASFAGRVSLFAIGLGQDVDADFLRALATHEDMYFASTDASDLAAIYARIAYALPCPGGAVWGEP